jgi:hypothetical protein
MAQATARRLDLSALVTPEIVNHSYLGENVTCFRLLSACSLVPAVTGQNPYLPLFLNIQEFEIGVPDVCREHRRFCSEQPFSTADSLSLKLGERIEPALRGLKAREIFKFMARLKSCADTKHTA